MFRTLCLLGVAGGATLSRQWNGMPAHSATPRRPVVLRPLITGVGDLGTKLLAHASWTTEADKGGLGTNSPRGWFRQKVLTRGCCTSSAQDCQDLLQSAERRDVGVAAPVDYQPTAAPPPSKTELNLECRESPGRGMCGTVWLMHFVHVTSLRRSRTVWSTE